MKLKLFEAFAGYGSQALALKRAGIPFKHVGISEIDKYAEEAHRALHGEVNNFGDIKKINPEVLPDIDLFTYSFPCPDVSVSGRGAGLAAGTRSGLLWECERLISRARPFILLMENVKNLVGKKHKEGFLKWCGILESLGYENFWQVLNARDYGVPQNRERVFMVSLYGGGAFNFPEKEKLGRYLGDVLEEKVDGKYYLSEEQLANLEVNLKVGVWNTHPSGKGMNGKVHTGEVSPTLTTNKGEGVKIGEREVLAAALRGRNPDNPNLRNPDNPNLRNPDNPNLRKAGASTKQRLELSDNPWSHCLTTVQKDSLVAEIPIAGNLCRNGHFRSENEVYSPTGVSPCLAAAHWTPKVLEESLRIRRMTPLESFRCMDVDDRDFWKVKKALDAKFYGGRDRSSSQLYKLAGNSICVRPMSLIFENIFK